MFFFFPVYLYLVSLLPSKTSYSFLIPRQRPHDKNETHRHHPDVRQRDPTLLCGWQTGDQQIVQHRQPDAKQDDRVGKGTVAHERIVVVVVLLVVLFRQQQFQFSDLNVLPGRAPATYLVPFCVHHTGNARHQPNNNKKQEAKTHQRVSTRMGGQTGQCWV